MKIFGPLAIVSEGVFGYGENKIAK